MRNIITEPCSIEELRGALEEAGPSSLLPSAGSEEWRRISQKPFVRRWISDLRERAAGEISEPLPAFTDALYRLFHISGERLPFERIYFDRRRRLGRACVCALLFPEEPGWLESVVRKTSEVLDEESWALPAHVQDPSGRDPMTIDLFCAETANTMGEIVTLLGERMPAALRERIRARVHEQVTLNFLEHADRFGWATTSSNWNAVCHQGVVGSALALESDLDLVARVIHIAAGNLRTFLHGFTSDGGCTEGPGYWEYGFGWFSVLNDQIERATGGRLSLFEGDEHVCAIATYGRKVTLENGMLVNFADSPHAVLRPSLLQYLADRLGDAGNIALAQHNYALLSERGVRLDDERCDLFFLGRLFLYAPEVAWPAAPLRLDDAWFPDLGVMVIHKTDENGNRWAVAAKGGHNAEHHNHNDCGSYILQVNGRMIAMEIGAPEYTRQFFGPERYEHLASRSLGHSVPRVNGFEQVAGTDRRARIVTSEPGPDQAVFQVELSGCYPAEAHCQGALRTVCFDRKQGRLSVEDRVETDNAGAVETAIITGCEVKSVDGGLQLASDDTAVVLIPRADVIVKDIEKHSYRDHRGQDAVITRIVLTPAERAARATVGYEFRIRPHGAIAALVARPFTVATSLA